MYHFIEVLDIDELVDISSLEEQQQDEFLNDFIEAAVANTYTHYLEDPEIPEEDKQKLMQAIDNDNLSPKEHQEIFASKYLQALYEDQSYSLKVEYLREFLEDVQQMSVTEPELDQALKDHAEYISLAISLPEEEQEPELKVVDAWKDFKAICVAKLDMFKE